MLTFFIGTVVTAIGYCGRMYKFSLITYFRIDQVPYLAQDTKRLKCFTYLSILLFIRRYSKVNMKYSVRSRAAKNHATPLNSRTADSDDDFLKTL